MASGSQVLIKAVDSVAFVRATVTWTSSLISENSHNLRFNFKINRLDGSSVTTYYQAFVNDTLIDTVSSTTCEANISSGNYTVRSDDSGLLTDSFTVKVRVYNSSVDYTTSTGTFTNLQLDRQLTIEQSSQATITVTKSDVALSSGDLIYPGDVLTITVEPNVGYKASLSVSGATGSSGSYTVTGNVTVSASTSLIQYTLSINAGTGSSISVKKISSPLASKDVNTIWTSGSATVYYNDVLQITFATTSPEYKLDTYIVNGSTFISGNTHTVTDNVSIATTTIKQGLVYLGNGSSFDPYLIYIGNGSDWDLYIPYIGNDSDWDICS